MAYQVDRFNGTFLVAVADGSIDTTTDLRLVGKNYAGYGELQNENFVHLLENFANTTPPPKAISGQLWYDNGKKKLRFYDGTRFKVAGGAEVSPTPPSGLVDGDFWWDSDAKQLYAWANNQFELIGPEISAEAGQSTITSAVVSDAQGSDRIILKIISDNEVIAVVSKTEFELGTSTPIPNFLNIGKGITLSSSSSGISTNDFKFRGTATNADRLGGVLASEYIRTGNVSFTDNVVFRDAGFVFREEVNDPKYSVSVIQNDLVIDSIRGNDVLVNIRDAGVSNTIARFSKNFINPGIDNEYSIGAQGLAWKSVTATTFIGNLTGNVIGNTQGTHTGNVIASDGTELVNAVTKQIGNTGVTVVGNFVGAFSGTVTGTSDNALTLNGKPGSESATASSVALRTAQGDIVANQFVGTADRADRTKIESSASDGVWVTGDSSTHYRTATTAIEAWTIAARDQNANISANLFQGTATAARYADLAEKYLTDAEYSVGTVVVVGGDAEVTAGSKGKRAIGVVSANPAFMMNSELEGGTYIALKGRVPVKVVGPVHKGDCLIASDNGYAEVADAIHSLVFAIALEDGNADVNFIEAVIL